VLLQLPGNWLIRAGCPCSMPAMAAAAARHPLLEHCPSPLTNMCAGAHAECTAQLHAQPGKIGYLFFHSQDLETAAGVFQSSPLIASCPTPAAHLVAGEGSRRTPRHKLASFCRSSSCQLLPTACMKPASYQNQHAACCACCAEDGTLWLGHDARDDMPQTVPALVACDCLREHGFEARLLVRQSKGGRLDGC